jgi:hypothetical protein
MSSFFHKERVLFSLSAGDSASMVCRLLKFGLCRFHGIHQERGSTMRLAVVPALGASSMASATRQQMIIRNKVTVKSVLS